MRRGLILAVLLGVTAALLTWTTPGRSTSSHAGSQRITAYLLDNGFHTDLVVPRAALMQRGGRLAQAVAELAPGDWIVIGWGDAKFYVDQSPISSRLSDGARAFFRPGNPSVLMLDPEIQDPQARYAADGRATLLLTRPAFDRMADRIEASLDLSNGGPRVAAVRPGDDARFFASRETFSILHLCNHWSAQVLNAAGLPIRPVRSILSVEVLRTARRQTSPEHGRNWAGTEPELDRAALGD
ncbi:DUF2459 domain-containing protein [Brevundimonas sp. SORGH_AS_0993]|uniref:DUF2459 domain-containing protein n=1 Tax=Brevundimonas sp. SORGH_AS_0993 TaxID=3041794 RepID=UPI00277FB0DB|nr:DUF2459 domain-containing protein [Brevundimonas sp. SORGH_AS_0993]MDQ1154931.1 uncharacterized protein (TIGR02117 family) [Brevundimonas sp. SORGH_AS_0993]